MLLPVGPVVDSALINLVSHLAVALIVHDRAHRPVNRELLPIDTQTGDLCVKIREVAPLQERVVAKADAGDDMGGTEGDLLHFREVLIYSAVKYHLADRLKWNEFLGPNLGCVENVEVELVLVGFGNRLNGERPFRIGTGLYGLL